MHRTKPAALALAAIVSGAIGSSIMNEAIARPARPSVEGNWGGRQIRLQADAHGAEIELDCAQGRITGPIKLDKSQQFSAKGSYEAYGPGPQQGDVSPAISARYSGKVTGDTLSLDITPDKGPKLSYTLTRGKNVKLIRCY